MLILNAEQTQALAPMPRVIECLEEMFRGRPVAPQRQVCSVPGGEGERLFLTMPAFDSNGAAAVKLVSFFPDNRTRGLATIQGVIVVFSDSGAPIAAIDGAAVTRLRTGAASALASKFLSRTDCARLVLIGTGALAPAMALAHCTVRPVKHVTVCGRRSDQASATAAAIRSMMDASIEVVTETSIAQAVEGADIVSCCTNSPTPVLQGSWLKAGTFIDLVGSFSPTKRESDDEVVRRSRIFVDTFEGALSEAGDLLDPLSRGVIERDRIEGELADLVCGRVIARRAPSEIILFKSVGTAIEDLATAQLIVSEALKAGIAAHAR